MAVVVLHVCLPVNWLIILDSLLYDLVVVFMHSTDESQLRLYLYVQKTISILNECNKN